MISPISVIIPSYKNPEYLDLCLKSLFENQTIANEVIVVLDGCAEESTAVLEQYPDVNLIAFEENRGQILSYNTGVTLATNERILIVNDDNIFGRRWDANLYGCHFKSDKIISINQVEPAPSIFKSFVINDLGRTLETFNYEGWLDYEQEIGVPQWDTLATTLDGQTWPIYMSKKWYMAVGGIDSQFPSAAVADHDFFLRCEMLGLDCIRSHSLHFYHFAGAATKKVGNIEQHNNGEMQSHEYFKWKWGFYSQMNLNGDNSKMPRKQNIQGITF
jgi:glycosyltransferase involved in cell wall biosynthesis